MKTTLKTASAFVLGLALAAPITGVAALLSRIYTFSDGSVLTATQLNAEFNNLVNGANSLNNANIATGAAISAAKISSDIDGSGISRNGTTGALSANPDGTTLELSGDAIQLKDAGISTAKYADLSVTRGKIALLAVSTLQLEEQAVTEAKLGTGAVTEGKIGTGAVTAAKIAAGAVGTAALASDAVTSATILNGSIAGADLAANTVAQSNIYKRSSTDYSVSGQATTGDISYSSTGNGCITSASNQVVTTTGLITSGRPVMITLTDDGSATDVVPEDPSISIVVGSGGGQCTWEVIESSGSTVVANFKLYTATPATVKTSPYKTFIQPASAVGASTTYILYSRVTAGGGNTSCCVNNIRMFTHEIN